MIAPLFRKIRQLSGDPVLRHWLFGRLFGRWPGEPSFQPHRPPYLLGQLPYVRETGSIDLKSRPLGNPGTPLRMELAGVSVELEPGKIQDLFNRAFDDIESHLSLHRFAWLNANTARMDPHWVDAIWSTWFKNYKTPDNSWVWHPYTASERAINVLTFARRFGWAGDQNSLRDCLSDHAADIASKLEYFGDHHTSNHLANNGRGLYLLGLWLGMETAADLGATILIAEAERIFTPSGLLREGSSHYHLLLAKNYRQVQLAAQAYNRPETTQLAGIAKAALAHQSFFSLPGGLPLIGDISPDCPPDAVLQQLPKPATSVQLQKTLDGWTRFDCGDWAGLWHAAADGWSQMPGHGHQDLGGFELHYSGQPLFIDLGRGAYGETGDAALYRSAKFHNGITIDDQDPYPPNKPYYNGRFRSLAGGPVPKVTCAETSLTLCHSNAARYRCNRTWQFDSGTLCLRDTVTGPGSHIITRRLHTPLLPEVQKEGVLLKGTGSRQFTVQCPGAEVTIQPVTRWRTYGCGTPAYQIAFSTDAHLPFSGEIKVDVINHG